MDPKVEQEIIKIIINQTNYDEILAKEKLKEWDNNFLNVIKEYLNPDFNCVKKEKKMSTNQKVFCSIRKFMDTAAYNYEKKKVYKEYLERHRLLEAELKKKNEIETQNLKNTIEKNKLTVKKEEEEIVKKNKNIMIKENKLDGIKIKEVSGNINEIN